MTPNITLHDVTAAIDTLTKNAQRPTVTAIRATLGNHGSASTILKFKRQIEQGTKPAIADSQPGIEHFRNLWQLAVAAGRSERDAEVNELSETIEALTTDNERLEAETSGLRSRQVDLERQRDQLIADLAKAQQDVASAQASGQQHASSAADALRHLTDLQQSVAINAEEMREQHSKELSQLRRANDDLAEKAHSATLDKATLRAELTAARHEIDALKAASQNTSHRAATAEERAHALSMALAEAAKRPAPTSLRSNRAAKAAIEQPSLLDAKNASRPPSKLSTSQRPANKKP